jgi:ubiquinone/menaquinone biosynthesis C-methylase UbiE
MRPQFGPEDAKRFYDRFGTLQDAQFYERAALRRLVADSDFEHASAVFELGCGTGRLASRLLEQRLGEGARYVGVDVSSTMIAIASRRLARWRDRATLSRVDGTASLPYADASFDRFVATYVFDIFPDSTITDVVCDAHRLLMTDGKLCVITSTEGVGPISRLVSAAWKRLYEINPGVVGGCRPLQRRSWLDNRDWSVEHSEVVTSWGISSEIVVARRV